MNMLLTSQRTASNLLLSLPHAAHGIGVPKTNGVSRFNAVFLYAKSQFHIIMLNWVEQSQDWLDSFVPVRQFYPVRLHNWRYVVEVKTLQTEAFMPKFNAQEPTKTLNLSVSKVKKQSLQKQVEMIGHALNIFCLDSCTTNRDSLKKDALELVRMLDDLLTQKKQSRFNIIASGTKKVIADCVTYDQTMQYRDPERYRLSEN